MSNPIDPNGRMRDLPSITANKKHGAGRTTDTSTSSNARGTPTEQVDTATASERRVALEAAIAATPNLDSARVDSIKQAIKDGQYPVDPERIAEKFMQLEGLLGD